MWHELKEFRQSLSTDKVLPHFSLALALLCPLCSRQNRTTGWYASWPSLKWGSLGGELFLGKPKMSHCTISPQIILMCQVISCYITLKTHRVLQGIHWDLKKLSNFPLITRLVDWRTALETRYCHFRVHMFTELAVPFWQDISTIYWKMK